MHAARVTLPAALAALAILVPAALAQVPALPTDPVVGVTLEVTPSGTTTVPLGSNAAFDVKVRVELQNMVCQSPAQVTVNLASQDVTVAGISGALPANVQVSVPAGQYTAATGAGSGTGNVTFLVSVTRQAMADHDHVFNITATGPAQVPGGCSAASPTAPAADSDQKNVAIKTGPAPPAETPTTTGGTSPATGTETTTKASFFLPLPAQVAVLAALGLARRRR